MIPPQPKEHVSDTPASFSAMYALKDGYNLVMYSMTHRFSPLHVTIHKCMGVRLILKCGMIMIWNGSLVHCGGKSRTNLDNLHTDDMRLFFYLNPDSTYPLRSKGLIEDSIDLHRKRTNICYHFEREETKCTKCNKGGCVIDLSHINMDGYNSGDIIIGDINDVGWIVVKGNPMNDYVKRNLNAIDETDGWNHIERNTDRMMKFSPHQSELNMFMLACSARTQQFLKSLKTSVLDKHLPSKSYIFGKMNLLKNAKPIFKDQLPHSDYVHHLSK